MGRIDEKPFSDCNATIKMSVLTTKSFILMAVHLFYHKWVFCNPDSYKDGCFILDGNNEVKYNSLNSDADIPCILDCLNDLNCTSAVINKSEKKCTTLESTDAPPDNIEIWKKMPAGIEGTLISQS